MHAVASNGLVKSWMAFKFVLRREEGRLLSWIVFGRMEERRCSPDDIVALVASRVCVYSETLVCLLRS